VAATSSRPRSPITSCAGPGTAREAAEFAGQAGEAALRRFAFEDAVRWYAQADASLASAGAGDAERARMKLALGEVRHAAGDRMQARSDLLEAAERAGRAARPDLLARAALGLSAGAVGRSGPDRPAGAGAGRSWT
jgi:hypothetical protein